MKVKIAIIRDLLFFIFLCSLFDNLKASLPFFYVCTAILGINIILKKGGKINAVVVWYIIVFLMFLLGILWAKNTKMFSIYINFDIIRMLECLVVMIWIVFYLKNEKDINKYLNLYIFVMIFLIIKLIFYTPLNYWGTSRLGETINMKPTTLGLSMAFSAIVSIYFWSLKKQKRYLVCLLLFAVISILTGSRMSLIVLLIGFSGYNIVITKGEKIIIAFISIIIVIFMMYMAVMNIKPLYNVIGVRFENFFSADNSEQSMTERRIFKKTAINLFRQNVLHGYGTEGFRMYTKELGFSHVTYSHCNYTEMLANYGIIGFSIYYIFLIWLFLKTLKVFNRNKIYGLGFTMILLILVSDYGYVSYYGIFQQFFIAIIYVTLKMKFLKSDEKNEFLNQITEKNIYNNIRSRCII